MVKNAEHFKKAKYHDNHEIIDLLHRCAAMDEISGKSSDFLSGISSLSNIELDDSQLSYAAGGKAIHESKPTKND